MDKDEKKTPVFETFGNDESAVCGPEGCNIQEHRDREKNQDKKTK